jgi:hypothetical protein
MQRMRSPAPDQTTATIQETHIMSTLVINDLSESKELDQAAVVKICGGFSLGWTVARSKPRAAIGGLSGGNPVTSIYNVTNNYIDYDYNVVNQNPTIFNVHNGAGNSGTIVNSFETLSLSAASPALIQGA